MSRSTRLSTAAHIMMYLAWNEGDRVRIDDIAKSANANPSRLRQLCSQLAQGGYIKTYKGAKGGIEAVCPPDQVSLLDLCVCIEDLNFFALTPHKANKKCPIGAAIAPTLSRLYTDYNNIFREYLKATTIMDLIEMADTQT
ncbi:Rrf2 family transcriptional regulator [Sulfidibacter corallicola]|uniref:Rrf2 family transcriptional regulator n=1 Tax=Sulfidibacter corallicola TaxID=2818388 RepID=A0A8A4TUH6_SULCO|nr:Rrf2 family transcriptional regulator [Sulfidibacter corallicola]QTD53609.1 Rrf2 family transcriptional regulator [Sulfidibacter corallicola]